MVLSPQGSPGGSLYEFNGIKPLSDLSKNKPVLPMSLPFVSSLTCSPVFIFGVLWDPECEIPIPQPHPLWPQETHTVGKQSLGNLLSGGSITLPFVKSSNSLLGKYQSSPFSEILFLYMANGVRTMKWTLSAQPSQIPSYKEIPWPCCTCLAEFPTRFYPLLSSCSPLPPVPVRCQALRESPLSVRCQALRVSSMPNCFFLTSLKLKNAWNLTPWFPSNNQGILIAYLLLWSQLPECYVLISSSLTPKQVWI